MISCTCSLSIESGWSREITPPFMTEAVDSALEPAF